MKKYITCFLVMGTVILSCKNNNIPVDNANSESSSTDSVKFEDKFNESSQGFSCGNNKLEIQENKAIFTSRNFQPAKRYEFNFLGFNHNDGTIIIVDNHNGKFAMINLCTGNERIVYDVKDSIIGIYTFDPTRYFIETWKQKNGIDYKEVWEIEPDLERTMQVDLIASDMEELETRHSAHPTEE